MALVQRTEIRNRWSTGGFVVLDGYLTPEELVPGIAALDSVFVPDDLGPPGFVPLAATGELPALPSWHPPIDPAPDSADDDDTG